MYVDQHVGDGTATAAVVLQSVFNGGLRYITAGGNAMRLRQFLEKGTQTVLAELESITTYPEGERQLAQVARTLCPDPALAKLMAEIFDIIGEYGRLEIRSGKSRHLEREYVEGMYWENGLMARGMVTDPKLLRTELENAAILISDLKIEEPGQLVPVLELALENGFDSLLVIAQELSDSAIGLLQANAAPEKLQIAAVKTPGAVPSERGAALLDMVKLTGGHAFLTSAGHSRLNGVKLHDLGRARRAWADLHSFGIVGGKGDPRALRKHIADLRGLHKSTPDVKTRQEIQERIGKLLGGSAVLTVGGATEAEIAARRDVAKRTSQAIRMASIEGVVPGGGVALLACRPALQLVLDGSSDPDERAAYRILMEALETPARTIAENAGYEPSLAMAELALAGDGHVFDVNAGEVVDLAQAGLFDVAAAQKTALQAAVACAALALTTDVLVHHAKFNPYKPQPQIQTG
jgi:chaperonin GroEL